MQFFKKTSPIGIFDSGIGGLTVAKRIIAMLPNENIVYFGDTARVPYGSKSNETVVEYSYQDAQFLINKNVKLKRLPRLPDNFVRLQLQKSNGQFKITIPRGLARSLRLSGGDILEAFIERGDLVLRVREIDVK